jgi:flagellar biosynthetic protein FliR
MNLLTLGFPLKIAVGFFFLGILFDIIALRLEDFIIDAGPLFDNLMRLSR